MIPFVRVQSCSSRRTLLIDICWPVDLHCVTTFHRVEVVSFAGHMLCLVSTECQFCWRSLHAPAARNWVVRVVPCVIRNTTTIGSTAHSLVVPCLRLLMVLNSLTSNESSRKSVKRESSIAPALRDSNSRILLHIRQSITQKTTGLSRTMTCLATTVPHEGNYGQLNQKGRY